MALGSLTYKVPRTSLVFTQQIQFHLANRDGQPDDCAALVHMSFELSE
jgi:hypothetical protein